MSLVTSLTIPNLRLFRWDWWWYWSLWRFDQWLLPTFKRCAWLGEKYFPDDHETKSQNHLRIEDPFKERDIPICFIVNEYEELIHIVSDFTLKQSFENLPPSEFWCRIKKEYPQLSERALKILLPFPTTHICVSAFSLYAATKIKDCNRLNAKADMANTTVFHQARY